MGAKVAFPLQTRHPNYAEKRLMFEESFVRMKTTLESLGGVDPEEFLGPDSGVHDFPKFVIWRCGPRAAGYRAQKPEDVKQDLLPFARFVVFARGLEALSSEGDTQRRPPVCLMPLPTAEETMAWAFLVEIIQQHIGRYPGSVADDERLLNNSLAVGSPEVPYLQIRR